MEKYVIIDLETTGQTPSKDDKIIEVGIVVIENNKITDHYSTLLNPSMPIPPFISNLTGIVDKDVEDAPTFKEKANEINDIFRDGYLIAHNVPFDLGFLNTELANNGVHPLSNPVLDTVELSRILYPKAPGYKLGQLAEFLNIHHNEPHRALSDAYVTAKLFLNLKEKLDSLPFETINQLLKLEKTFKSDLYPLLKERYEKSAFSTVENENIVSYSGLAFRHIEVVKEKQDSIEVSYGDYLDSIYEKDGSMQQHMKNYEKRNGQREMSEAIFDAFQIHKHALLEAETGTGKSLAYLIPAIYDAKKTKRRTVISTHTTQLQAQLLEEEIPLIQKLVDFEFKAALLKGKSHYISLEKFERSLDSDQQDNYDMALTKAMILVWITETETGDIDEIHLPSSGYLFYRKVSTDTEGYIDPYSPWFSHSYYQKARKRAQQADIIITNHALLCTDMFNDYQFLPSYDKVIVDEAHHLEETASRHYGLKLDYINMQFILNQIGSTTEAKSLGKVLSKYSFDKEQLSLEKWDTIFVDTKYEVDDLFRSLFQYVVDQQKKNKSLSDIGRTQYRFETEKEDPKKWNTIEEMATRLTFYLRDLIHILAEIEQYFEKKEVLNKFDKDELKVNIELLQSFIDRIEKLFLIEESIEQVRWIEIETYGSRNAVYLYSEPTDMSQLLANDFFTRKQSVILTSATLTMRNSFTFIQNRLGLPEESFIAKNINSPFLYDEQVQLMIPDDFPDIKYGNLDDFVYATCEAILSLAEITNGRMLVLFTSYDMLRKSYRLLRETIDLDKYVLIAQGISSGSRTRLKKNFQTFDEAILLGTSSFWEGVDIPGDDLSCLMIVRLPFQPPDHPIYEAKSNYLKEAGKNAFFELSLPNAVIRFKQGFGRLIRSTNDRGIVFVCDARIIKARYGKFFTESIPNVPITFDSTPEIMKKAEKWF
ncbi:ATP-dependent helicase DinG [Virgibacillus profundi]|uniref:3'-5' exonuclease DinG n=1 Tax=Virgibacillus profundi TaxID=2024555 RepID=A0A2A2ID16_9BACI|nr:ATP-dependent DNA helicase DinG [Virgibacillus profundi]PAV29472.1 ATP-dependent helicase DinG [Virgibacillus profundi]PXY53641.1 ATP-dependent helicase DinG [Virgibacillus profundi]